MIQKNIGFEDRITDEHKALITEFLDGRTERHKFAMTMVYKNGGCVQLRLNTSSNSYLVKRS